MTASPNRCYSGHHKATEEEDDQGILGKEIWKKKWWQQDTSTAGGRWRRQHKTELDGDKWSVDYVPSGLTRHSHVKSLVPQIFPPLRYVSKEAKMSIMTSVYKYVHMW